MIMIIAVLAVAILAALFWLQTRRKNAALSIDSQSETTQYHAVSVRPGMDACPGARTISATRFLSVEAPCLPLPDCGEEECSCRFVHHSDRRAGEDRRTPFQRSITAVSANARDDRRVHDDRRHEPADDHLQFG